MKKKALFSLILLFVVVCIANLAFAGQTAKQHQKKQAQKAQKVDKVKLYEQKLAKLLAPIEYHYSAAGKPDPFKPFFRSNVTRRRNEKAAKKRPDKCATPLECMDVGQLTLVGVIIDKDGNAIAMAQDASGIGYTLKKGMKIGFNDGKVVKIDRSKVVVRERIIDLNGQPTFRDRILYLHPEEENGTR